MADEVRVAWLSFVAFFRTGLASSQTYLADLLVGLLTYPVELAMTFMMWRLFLTETANGLSMPRQDVLAYYALLLLVGRLGPSRFVSLRLESDVVNGGLAILLVRPTAPWAAIAGRGLAPTFLNFLVLTPIAAAAAGFALGRVPHPLAFAVWMALAILLRTLLRLIVGTSAFWMHRIVGLVHAVEFFTGIVSGGVLPLSVFPDWVQGALGLSPFPLMIYVPIRAMLGTLDPAEMVRLAITGFAWAGIFAAVLTVLWRRGSRKFLGFGI